MILPFPEDYKAAFYQFQREKLPDRCGEELFFDLPRKCSHVTAPEAQFKRCITF